MNLLPQFAATSRFPQILPTLSLAVMMLCAYYPAADAGFIWDDDAHILEDTLLTNPGGLYRIWFAPDDSIWNYWPISRTSFWIERRLWGINATASHLVNIALHLSGVLILYFGLRRFRVPCAWFIAALFALHPIFVESVTWITERKNVLSGVFYLSCIWSYLAFDENRQWRNYAAALLLFACALLSKSSTVMLPVILIFCRIALRRPWTRKDILQLVPFFILSLAAGLGSIWFEENYIGSHGADFHRSWVERFAVAGRIPFAYLRLLLLPWPLSFVYPRWEIDTGNFLAFLPLTTGIFVALFLLWKYSTPWGRPLALALGAFLATLFPVLNFFDIYGMRYSFVANHWVYLPALPILILIGAGTGSSLKNSPTVRRTTFTAILVACGILTWKRNHVLHDRETLWTDTIAKNAACWMAHNNLGHFFQEQGRAQEAIAHYHEALRIKPDYEDARLNLGALLQKQGKIDDAIVHYLAALRFTPDSADAHFHLGTAYHQMEEIDKALKHYRQALITEPGYQEIYNNLGLILMNQGDANAAIENYRTALRISPDDTTALFNLGNSLAAQGRLDDAITHYLEAVRIDPDYAIAHNNLGAALQRKKDFAAAIHHFREALRVDPGDANTAANLRQALILQEQSQ